MSAKLNPTRTGKDCHEGDTVRRPSNTCDALTNTPCPPPLPGPPARDPLALSLGVSTHAPDSFLVDFGPF